MKKIHQINFFWNIIFFLMLIMYFLLFLVCFNKYCVYVEFFFNIYFFGYVYKSNLSKMKYQWLFYFFFIFSIILSYYIFLIYIWHKTWCAYSFELQEVYGVLPYSEQTFYFYIFCAGCAYLFILCFLCVIYNAIGKKNNQFSSKKFILEWGLLGPTPPFIGVLLYIYFFLE